MHMLGKLSRNVLIKSQTLADNGWSFSHKPIVHYKNILLFFNQPQTHRLRLTWNLFVPQSSTYTGYLHPLPRNVPISRYPHFSTTKPIVVFYSLD